MAPRRRSAITLSILAAVGTVRAATAPSYNLVHAYTPSNFFDGFDFYSGLDPTHGYVQYTNSSYALSSHLYRTTPKNPPTIHLGVDATHTYPPTSGVLGRPSIRLESKATYTQGLFILSLSHIPYGCGVWPAFWSYGPSWPSNGEIDVIEAVNRDTHNQFALHTSAGCTIAGSGQKGTLLTDNCDVAVADNAGCTVRSETTAGWGARFAQLGGGTYAMEWTSSGIRIWFWPKGREPPSLKNGAAHPNVSAFGEPSANFAGSCDFGAHFAQHKLVFDTTFCGDYAGNTYASSGCPMVAGLDGMVSCEAFVGNRPKAMQNAFWDINWLRVYQTGVSAAPVSTTSRKLSSVKPAISTKPRLSSSLAHAGMGKISSSKKATSTAARVAGAFNGSTISRSSDLPPATALGYNTSIASSNPPALRPSPASSAIEEAAVTVTVVTWVTTSSCPTPLVCPATSLPTIYYGFHSTPGAASAMPALASNLTSLVPYALNTSSTSPASVYLTIIQNGTQVNATVPATALVTAVKNGTVVTTAAGAVEDRKPQYREPGKCQGAFCANPAQGL